MIRRRIERARQRGVALITAMFVVALAVIAGVAMFEASNLGVHRTANLALTESAWWYADGVESWVKWILIQDSKLNQTDSFADIWAQPVPLLPIENGAIRGRVEDLQGRFNLTNLAVQNPTAAAPYLAQFQRLIDNLPNFDASRSSGVGAAIRDWMLGSNTSSGSSGASDGDYLGEQPPYRAAARPMASISELLLVKGMTKELYAALKPYVAALPSTSPTAVNLNTALAPVLASLGANVDKGKLERFIAQRNKEPLKSAGELNSTPEINFLPTPGPGPAIPQSVNSSYFELQAEIAVGSGRVALYSVFFRPSGGVPVVIAHSTDTE
ncbi:MAG: ral secretion pathway protein GspK [Nevskia sp.]|nr:ral secretion pathway protein GspK [Nevskia sp.]